jgi:hypothetical protein
VTFFSVSLVAVGAFHACAVDDTGSLYCWGDNQFCQLGHPTACNSSSSNGPQLQPLRVQAQLGHLVEVTVGDRHTCAMTGGKALYCWGDNRYGFLGNSSAPPVIAAAPVSVSLNAVKTPPRLYHLTSNFYLPFHSFSRCFLFLLPPSQITLSRALSLIQRPSGCTVGVSVRAQRISPAQWMLTPRLPPQPGYFGAVGVGPPQSKILSVREPALVARVAEVGSVSVRHAIDCFRHSAPPDTPMQEFGKCVNVAARSRSFRIRVQGFESLRCVYRCAERVHR